jgi:DNA repair protein RAD57
VRKPVCFRPSFSLIAFGSAAGKTQLALQLSLCVQLPPELGGISGSACYLTTSSKLPTSRLLQLIDTHPLLSHSLCGLSGIQTLSTETIPKLLFVLSNSLPLLLRTNANDPSRKEVKLLVIDALAELFHSTDKTSTTTLVERARNISEISKLLHSLASKHRIAVLVLNEVIDVFDREPEGGTTESDLIYRNQARWFSRADSFLDDNRKEASLGLVWANQVNVRIMLSRTGRRRYFSEVIGRTTKHRRIETSHPALQMIEAEGQTTLIRRLNVIFSSVSSPTSLDFIISAEGLSLVPDDMANTPEGSQPTFTVQRGVVSSALSPPDLSHRRGYDATPSTTRLSDLR